MVKIKNRKGHHHVRRTLRKMKETESGSIFDGAFYWICVIVLLCASLNRIRDRMSLSIADKKQDRLGSPEKGASAAAASAAAATAATAAAQPVAPLAPGGSACVRDLLRRSNVGEQKGKNRNPILYLNPGGHRTSNKLQNLMRIYNSNLNEDGIFVVTEDTHCGFLSKGALQEYFNHGVDIFISNSATRNLEIESWKSHFETHFRQNTWEIRVLIGYRPFFDAIRDNYYVLYNNLNRPRMQMWPKDGGLVIPPVCDDERFINAMQQDATTSAEPLPKIFQALADQVVIYDTSKVPSGSKRKNYMEEFFCDILEGASGACSGVQKALSVDSVAVDENRQEDILVATKLFFDQIATTVHEKGWIKSGSNRYETKNKIAQHFRDHNMKRTDLPLICCEDQTKLDLLKQKSITQEQLLFPKRQGEEETVKLFDEMMEDKMLCSVDTEKVLIDEKWQAFLKTL